MPRYKDLKRLIRARMQKTGESYTTARARILEKSSPPAAQVAKLAGMSDEAVRAKTGRTWRQWVRKLDSVDAIAMSHREIAKHLHESYEISGWWAQMVTVGYERIRGLREIGQRRDGGYNANKSKTFAVPIAKLYRAFSVKRTRERWLPGVDLKIRTSTAEKSMRITWPDETSVHAYFTSKGPQKSQVAIQHVGLPAKKDVAARKEFWAERFGVLAEIL
ncbi:MAG: hypothetical protein ACYS0G_16730 [Planctomycetota bacterium]|jgi:hypothetical protein